MTSTPSIFPMRPFGRTGQRVSCIGLGGWHLGVPESDEAAVRLVHTAIGAGINFLDNAWDYNDGLSEERMGRAIADRRDQVFLMTKVCTHGRDAKVAMRQLEDSLRRLQDRLPRPLADPRGRLRRRAGEALRARRRRRSARQGAAAGEGPLRRLHRPQGSGAPPGDAGARLRVGRLPAAAQLLRRVVPQLRDSRCCPSSIAAASRRSA